MQVDRDRKRRNALLAMVHIAKKEMGLTEGEYEAILSGMKAKSAGELNIVRLERLVRYMKHLGWKPKTMPRVKKSPGEQAKALREKAREIAGNMRNGEKRLNGLVKKICRVESLEWCTDVGRLKKLLLVLGKIRTLEN